MALYGGFAKSKHFSELGKPLLTSNGVISSAARKTAARLNLGLVLGTNVQAYSADLAAIAALLHTDDNFIVGNGTAWVAESGATARTSLGLDGAISLAGAKTFTGIITPTGGIAAAGGFSATPRHLWIGSTAPMVAGDFNNSTPSTTETYVSEIFVPCNMTITGVALFNGSDVTGNVTVGLATSAGAPIAAAKSASTAGAGTDAIQLIPFATPYAALGPATYFIQVQYNSATARYNTHVLGKHAVLVQTAQTYGTLASFTAPTTFVTAVGNVGGLY